MTERATAFTIRPATADDLPAIPVRFHAPLPARFHAPIPVRYDVRRP